MTTPVSPKKRTNVGDTWYAQKKISAAEAGLLEVELPWAIRKKLETTNPLPQSSPLYFQTSTRLKRCDALNRYMERRKSDPSLPFRTPNPIGGVNRTARKERARKREVAKQEAKEIIEFMVETQQIDKSVLGNEALALALEIMRAADTYPLPVRMKAMSKVLEYTMAKPEQAQKVTLEAGQSFLDQILEEKRRLNADDSITITVEQKKD